jgi:hypothetical protein
MPVNGRFLKEGGTPDQFHAAITRTIELGWIWRHESGTYVKFTPVGAEDEGPKLAGTRGLAMRSEVHAMAASAFICAAVFISQASAYPSVAIVASPPTDVSANRYYRHHRGREGYRAPPHPRCQYHYFPRYEWSPGCGYWWDYP